MTDSVDHELDGILEALEIEEASGGISQLEDPTHVIAGRYRIEKELGAGGMGRVLLVRHQRLGKLFALKLMQADFSQRPEAEQIFRREAQLASQLAHPNIVETVDFGHDPNWGWFIAMQYLEGEALSVHIERESQLPIPVVCDITIQLADALRHSHQKGVVHSQRHRRPARLADRARRKAVDPSLHADARRRCRLSGRGCGGGWSRWPGMIRRPTVYETVALPLSYSGVVRAKGYPSPGVFATPSGVTTHPA